MSVKRQILGANDDRNMATLWWFIYRLNFASSVGYILKRRSGVDTPNNVIDNLNARINAWWVMIGIIFIASLLGFMA